MSAHHGRPAGSPAGLSYRDERLLADLALPLPFRKGAELGVQGERCDHLYLLARGRVLLRRRNRAGESHALYLLGSGDLFGEGSLRPERRWLVTVRAVTDGLAYSLPASQLPRLTQYFPRLTAQVLMLLSTPLVTTYRRLDLATITRARERVLGFLAMLAEHQGQPAGNEVWVPLGLTQAEIGQMVGLARETVARTLAELEAERRIRRKGRHGIWLRM